MSVNERADIRAGYAFILIFALMAVGIAITGYVHYRSYERNSRATMESELSSIAELKVGELVLWRKERLGDGAVLFKNAAFSALVRRFLEKPEDADAQRQLQAWMGKYHTAYQYSRVALYDTQGIRRMSAPEGPPGPVDSHIPKDVTAILRGGQVILRDFHRYTPDSPIHLSVVVPISDERDDSRPLGVLALRIDPTTYLYPFITRWPTPSQTAETLLVRRDGSDALFLNEIKFHKNAALNLRIPLTKTGIPTVMAALGQTGIVEGVDYNGAPVIANVSAIPDSPWYMVSKIQTSELYAPVRERLWQTLALVGFILLGAGAAMVLIWRQMDARYRERDKAAEDILESEARFRQLADATFEGVVITEKGRILDVNKSFLEMLGYEKTEEVVGKNALESVTPEYRDLVAGRMAAGYEKPYEVMATRKDGSTFLTEVHGRTKEIAGRPIRISAVRDITERKLAEEKLHKSAEEIEDLYNNAPCGYHSLDKDGLILRINNTELAWLGYTRDEVIGKINWKDLITPKSLQIFQENFPKLIKRGFINDIEIEIIRKDGTILLGLINATVIYDPSGNFAMSRSTIIDITERKKAENRLKLFRDALNLSSDAVLIMDGETARPVDFNRAAYEQIGYTREEMFGLPALDIIVVEPGSFVWKDRVKQVKESGGLIVERNHRKKDGSLVPMETALTVVETEGKEYLVAVVRDITERKRVEGELIAARNQLQGTLDAIPDLLFELGLDGRYYDTHAPHPELLAAPSEILLGKLVSEILPPPAADVVLSALREAHENGLSFGKQFELELPQGKLWFELSIARKASVAGQDPRFIVLSRDITERVKIHDLEITAKSLELTNRDLTEFAHIASHDLQEPLRTIIAFSDRLESKFGAELSPKSLDYLRRIRYAGVRMGQLLQDLLSYSLVSGGHLNFERVDLSQIVTGVLEDLQGAIGESGAILGVGSLPIVSADPSQMRQMFQNLISNSIKYRKPGGHPNIKVFGVKTPVWNRGAMWEVIVEDDGIGFENEHAGKIFKLFERLHGHSEYDGTGVGLATTLKIVQRHGWTIKADGEPGVGAKFTILMMSLEE